MRDGKQGLFCLVFTTVLAVMLSVGNTAMAHGSFLDWEHASGNSFQAWASTLWVQTTRSDFEAGVLNNVDTFSRPGDVKLITDYNAGGANLILFWDGDAPPLDWTCISDEEGEDFFQRFPRGADSYGGLGGNATHDHIVTLLTCSVPSESVTVRRGNFERPSDTHTHILSSGFTSMASNLPPYRDLKVIKYSKGVPPVIPAGAIALFDSEPPSGWTRYSAQDNYFVRGAAIAGSCGGSNVHTHTVDVNLEASTDYVTVNPGQGVRVAGEAHTHDASGVTDWADNRPPFITVILARANTDVPLCYGMIGMFDAIPSGSWEILSDSGGPFNSRFIVGGSSYGLRGGSVNHSHPELMLITGSPSEDNKAKEGTQVAVASSAHTHNLTLSFSDADHLPPYCNVIFAKARYVSQGTLASQILDTGIASARWDVLAWDETVLGGTEITFEVRASNIPFAKGAVTPSWIWVGGHSPVSSGLPSGRYKQWRVTLVTSNPSRTPILHEVRVYYYPP